MKFHIEQIALAPRNPAAALELLTAMGAAEWVRDHVEAEGHVFGILMTNRADLAFNYTMIDGKELEILNYTGGRNWVDARDGGLRARNTVSHLGMHVASEEELDQWRKFFAARGISVAQAVTTTSHTNPAIKDTRHYEYVIFDTKDILGVDLKFIRRILL